MDLFNFEKQVAVVTGGGSGIGKICAEALAENGATIVLLGRTLEKIQNTADEISNKTGATVSAFTCDVTEKKQINDVVLKIIEKYDRIDILVNNAGTTARGSIETLEENDWDKVMDTNVKSVFLMSQAVIPFMKKAQYGRIINTASVAGNVSLFFGTVYGPSKAGVIHLTKQLSGELAKYNITANAFSPWFFKTDLNSGTLKDEEFKSMVENRTPMKRLGQLDELKTTVLYFASKGSSYVTGQNVFVDGGMTSFGL
ncbi:SDR family NAD(P)-dependent oxidoreductase [Virgibacillus sp. DJP39]|uniref:SDR family NAD(P)-dependent oxidoreductase n=1 Tax=Virgibacillus sp. DJP39 TaxID=3409790 RepID=UPI003BB50103